VSAKTPRKGFSVHKMEAVVQVDVSKKGLGVVRIMVAAMSIILGIAEVST